MKTRNSFKASEILAGEMFRMEEKKEKRMIRREAEKKAKEEAEKREIAA